MRDKKRKFAVIAITILLVVSILYLSLPFFEKLFLNIESRSQVEWQNIRIHIPDNAKYIKKDSNILIYQVDQPECNLFIYIPTVDNDFLSIEKNIKSYFFRKQNEVSNFQKIQFGGEPALKFDITSQIEDTPEGGVYFVNKSIVVLYKNMNDSKLLIDVLGSIIFVSH